MKRATMLLVLVVLTVTDASGSDITGRLCKEFVERLIADDYRTFLAVRFEGGSAWSDCKTAHEANKDDVVYLLGLAKNLEMHTPGRRGLDQAVKLLRKAAEKGYEPAIFQLLRYKWWNSALQDPFLLKRYGLWYSIPDDPGPYIEQLKSSKSMAVRNFLLGFIVRHMPLQRMELAREIAIENVRRGSRKAKLYLGIMHVGGYGVERDKKKGFALIKKAALLGDLEAQVTYGVFMYCSHLGPKSGSGTTRGDMMDACRFLAIAANRGHRFATALLQTSISILTENRFDTADEWKESKFYRNELLEIIACTAKYEVKSQLLNRRALPACPE